MGERYEIQQRDGFTDGRPSWTKHLGVASTVFYSREGAEARLRQLQQENPTKVYRIRKRKK